jgi:hypothetical protein
VVYGSFRNGFELLGRCTGLAGNDDEDSVGHRGELIVDAVAGLADGRSGRRVDGRTLFPVFSVTQAVTALAVHLQAKQAAGFWLGGELGASDPLVGDHREIIYSPGAGGTVAWADLQLCKRPFIGVRGHTVNRPSSVPQCATYMRKPRGHSIVRYNDPGIQRYQQRFTG